MSGLHLTPGQRLGAAMARVYDPSGYAPYFGVQLRGLVRHETTSPEIPTLAVSKDMLLFWNPNYCNTLSVSQLAFGLLHEVMHVTLKHFERAEALGVVYGHDLAPELAYKVELANKAQDACINEGLREIAKSHGVELPSTWVYPETLDQPLGLTFEQRYRLLLEKNPTPPPNWSKGQGGVGAGNCGSCAAGHGHAPDDAPEGRSQADIERFRRETATAIREHTAKKGRGSVPGELGRWAEDYLEPAKVDWREHTRNAIRDSADTRPGADQLNWRGISRRQAGLGFGAGVPILPATHSPVPRVGVIFDTSGSMGEKELSEGAREVNGILQEIHAQITLAVVDASLHGLREVVSIEDAVAMLKGGGGTDMRPGFKALQEREPQPEVVVVLTDGQLGSGCPRHAPTWCNVIWVLLGEHATKPCTWGEQIFVGKIGDKEAA